MTTISIPYFRAKPGAGGTARYFWDPSTELRRKGFATRRLSADLATAMSEAQALNEEVARWRGQAEAPARTVAQGSVRALIAAYKASKEWERLADKTKYDHGWHLKAIDAWIGDEQAAAVTPVMVHDMVEALYDAGKFSLAGARVRVLHRLYRVGRLKGFTAANPAEKQCLISGERKVEPILWTDEMVAAVVATADAMGRHSIGTSVFLNVWFGQRQGDILALTTDALQGGGIVIRQRKTGRTVALPVDMVPALLARFAEEVERRRSDAAKTAAASHRRVASLDAARRRRESAPLLIINERTGRAYTADNFRHVFRAICVEAQRRHPDLPLAGARFCWLRHSSVSRLAEAGCELPEIAAITGHELSSVVSIIEHYLVRTEKMARNAFRKRIEHLKASGYQV